MRRDLILLYFQNLNFFLNIFECDLELFLMDINDVFDIFEYSVFEIFLFFVNIFFCIQRIKIVKGCFFLL